MSEVVALKECTFRCKKWNPKDGRPDDQFTYIDISSVDRSSKVITSASAVACAEAPSRARQLVRAGDILVSTVRPNLNGVAKVQRDLDGATASTGYCVLRPKADCLDQDYLFHWVKTESFISEMTRRSTGANYPAVTDRVVRESAIPLPPLPEQRRIAAILDKADALRAKRREAIAKLDQLLQSVFLEMFGDPVTNPKHWAEGRVLGEAADVASGITKGRKIKDKSTRAVAYLAVANVQDRVLDLDTVKEIEATEQEIEKYRLLPGDLLLTEGGDPDKLGRGALWQGQLDPCIHQNHIFRVRVKSEDIDPVYLSWLVSSSRGKRYFLRSAKQTTGIASINMTQLRSFPLLVPPLELQKRFRRFVMDHYKKMEMLKQSGGRIDELFKSIQQQAFQTAA